MKNIIKVCKNHLWQSLFLITIQAYRKLVKNSSFLVSVATLSCYPHRDRCEIWEGKGRKKLATCWKAVLTKSRSHWKCRLGLQNHTIFVCLHAFLLCMLCFYVYTHVCFHLISNVHIVRAFENRISFQTFEKWHNVSYRYVSLVTSETSDIWSTSAWREGWGKSYLSSSKTEFYSKS